MSIVRNFAAGLVAVAFLACFTLAATAQDIAGKGKEAEALATSGKYAEALAALDDATGALWEKMPLACRRVLWVADRAAGFGIYNPRETNVYKAGDAMLAYAEPVGFGWRKSGDLWHTDMVADLVIRSADGKELYRQADFGTFALSSRARNREFLINLTVTLTGISPGKYIAETVLRDNITGKKNATCALPFEIAP